MALHTGVKPPPWEWAILEMCRTYGCMPSELMDEDFETVMTHFRLMQIERQAQQMK